MFDHVKVHDILQMDFEQPITEQDLIDMKFKKVNVSEEESGDNYYGYDLGSLVLVGSRDLEGYAVNLSPHDKKYTKLTEVMLLIEALKGDE